MGSLLLYGFLALALMGMVGTGIYKVKEWGADEVRQEWQAATLKAKSEAEAERQRQDALRQQQDQKATRRLADEKKRTTTLMASLDAHIRVAGAAAQCPIPPVLFNDWNAANAGPQGLSPGAVPPVSPKTPATR